MADISQIPTLSDISSWASPEEIELAKIMLEAGQDHLFAGWKVGADEEKKHKFFQQVSVIFEDRSITPGRKWKS